MDTQCEMPLVSAPEAILTDLMVHLHLQEDLAQVDHYMQSLVTSPVLTLSQPARHVVSAGGKRLRAALVLLAARLNDYHRSGAVAVACAVELIHAASLVHDDLIDQSPRRRGLATVHSKWFRLAAGRFFFHFCTASGSVMLLYWAATICLRWQPRLWPRVATFGCWSVWGERRSGSAKGRSVW